MTEQKEKYKEMMAYLVAEAYKEMEQYSRYEASKSFAFDELQIMRKAYDEFLDQCEGLVLYDELSSKTKAFSDVRNFFNKTETMIHRNPQQKETEHEQRKEEQFQAHRKEILKKVLLHYRPFLNNKKEKGGDV